MDQETEAPAPEVTHPRLSRRGTFLGSVIALLVLAGLAWLAWHLTHPDLPATSGSTPGGQTRPGASGAAGTGGGRGSRGGAPPTTVGTAAAERSDVPIVLEALGTVTPAATAVVRPQVTGVLNQVLFREGQEVKAGQLLATLDPRQFEMALMQATGQRLRDEAQVENARLTLQRYQTLLAQDSIARQDVDTQAALVKQLEGTIAADRAAEGAARINVSYTRIVAPISGRVGLRVVDVGNLVGSNDANGIAVITQLAPVDVEFAVPQDRVGEIQARLRERARMPVTALDRTRTQVLETGAFATLDNAVDTQTGTVRAKARFPNKNLALFPNQFVNVRLLLRTLTNAVVVPVAAIRHGSNGDFVFVLDQVSKTVKMQPVTVGQATTDKIVIATGLEAGATVITEGADRLRDGARVVLPGDAPQTGARRGAGRNAAGDASAGAGAATGAGAEAAPRARGKGNVSGGDATGTPGRGTDAGGSDAGGARVRRNGNGGDAPAGARERSGNGAGESGGTKAQSATEAAPATAPRAGGGGNGNGGGTRRSSPAAPAEAPAQ
ncbi:MAG: efflux RND transporter periplasmic adaptor subunit [Casimicrobiaceae bacterium]